MYYSVNFDNSIEFSKCITGGLVSPVIAISKGPISLTSTEISFITYTVDR